VKQIIAFAGLEPAICSRIRNLFIPMELPYYPINS